MVGVGAKGRNNLKSVHIRLAILSMDQKASQSEIVSISPHNLAKEIGQVKQCGRLKVNLEAEGKMDGNPMFSIIKILFNLSGKKASTTTRTTESSYPYEVLIANASGTANRAIWEFYRGESIGAIGQYNLQIKFRIKNPLIYNKICYCIDWNVEVNGRRLRDHEIELANNKWNIELNGRRVMTWKDKNQNYEYANGHWRDIKNGGGIYEIITMIWKGKEDKDFEERKEDKDFEERKKSKGINTIRKIINKIRKNIKNQKKIKKYRKEINKLVSKEDPEAKNRMLRPLILKYKPQQTLDFTIKK